MKKFCPATLLIVAMFIGKVTLLIAQSENIDQWVHIIYLEKDITLGTAKRVNKFLSKVEKSHTRAVIFEIDVPTGKPEYALFICKEINKLKKEDIQVYAYIPNQAWHAGAAVALTCSRIYMRKEASLGAPQPVQYKDKKIQREYRKGLRTYFAACARKRSLPPILAEAMVDPQIEVKQIYYQGKRLFKTPDQLIAITKQLSPSQLKQIREVKTITTTGQTVLFTAPEAKEYGFCDEIYPSLEFLLKVWGLEGCLQRKSEPRLSDFVPQSLLSLKMVAAHFMMFLGLILSSCCFIVLLYRLGSPKIGSQEYAPIRRNLAMGCLLQAVAFFTCLFVSLWIVYRIKYVENQSIAIFTVAMGTFGGIFLVNVLFRLLVPAKCPNCGAKAYSRGIWRISYCCSGCKKVYQQILQS